jgi:regulator of RNase E activity RraA
MFCTALQKCGVVGVVTDSAVRDRTGIQQRTDSFQVFCAGLVVSHGYGVFLDFNVTVSVCGLTIKPGELLHGDESGLLTIPLEIAERVVDQATATHEFEREYFDFLRSDSFTFEGLRQRMGGH